MKISNFDFELPENLIASHPPVRRDSSRMIVVNEELGIRNEELNNSTLHTPHFTLKDKHIHDFIDYLEPGDVVVFNNSRVIPARFNATDKNGNVFEITLHTEIPFAGEGVSGEERRGSGNIWLGLCKKFNKLNAGDILILDDFDTKIEIIDKDDESGLLIKFIFSSTINPQTSNLFTVLDRVGKMPLPPYMKRGAEDADRERYQTVYADPLGSMAAPTAGLHFTPELLAEIEKRGAKIVNITLHVGAGTWMPVKSDDLSGHKMHSEWGCITDEQAEIINNATRVIAVGTTSLRLLESAACLTHKGGECRQNGDEGGIIKYTNRALSMAKSLRKSMTMYECLLWKKLRKSPNGFAFRKQHPVGKYIVDFINLDKKLIVELDGALHGEEKQIIHDVARDKFLQDSGFRIIRFWNNEVFKKMDMVLDTIYHYLTSDDVPDLRDFYSKIICPPSADFISHSPPVGVRQPMRVQPFCGTTNIFITPGYKFRVVDVLLTNFHLPKSTLFILVCAFAGTNEMKSAYAHAVAEKYRFFSYGDSCLLFRKEN